MLIAIAVDSGNVVYWQY